MIVKLEEENPIELNNIKQVIIIRKDLKMRRGKEIAQGAHASMAFLLGKLTSTDFNSNGPTEFKCRLTPLELAWLSGNFKKVCVQVNSEEELLRIHNAAKIAGLESHLVRDQGLTEFNEPTYTCCAIGPNLSDDIDKITGNLTLY